MFVRHITISNRVSVLTRIFYSISFNHARISPRTFALTKTPSARHRCGEYSCCIVPSGVQWLLREKFAHTFITRWTHIFRHHELITVVDCNIVIVIHTGTGKLPGPVGDMRAVKLTNSTISLVWNPPADNSNVTSYVVHYQKVNNATVHENTIKLDQVRFV